MKIFNVTKKNHKNIIEIFFEYLRFNILKNYYYITLVYLDLNIFITSLL